MTRTELRITMAFIMLLGLVLRLIASRGDLSYDEVWSLTLLQGITSPDQIFWKINHVNNHFLNSLWLYYVGPDASVFLQRGMALFLGMLTLPVAYAWGARRNRRIGLITMALFSFSLPTVSYSSEARGYAGLILCTILGALLVEDALNGKKHPWLLGLVVWLGIFSHLNMGLSIIAYVVWTFWAVWQRDGFREGVIFTFWLFLPGALLLLPFALCVFPPALEHRFDLGLIEPFDLSVAPQSWGAMLRYSTRIGTIEDQKFYLPFAVYALWLVWHFRVVPRERAIFYIIAIFGIPISLIAMRLPNLDQPRYYLISSIPFMFMLCELVGYRWREKWGRIAAGGLVALIIWGEGYYTLRFLEYQRGHYQDAVAVMTANGPATYGSDAPRNVMIVNYFARRLGVSATFISEDAWCIRQPDWLLTFTFDMTTPAPTRTMGMEGCQATFNNPQAFNYFGMNGFQWNLYHRE